MSDCFCSKTYTCLRCEDIANGRFIRANRKIAECGTRSGYKRHRKLGEEACEDCKSAQNEAVKEYLKQKRAS